MVSRAGAAGPAADSSRRRFLAALSVAALIAASTTDIGIAPFLLTIIVDGIVTLSYGRTTRKMARTADEAASGLAILAQVLEIIERENFRSTMLAEICRRLETQGMPPSRRIGRLETLIEWLNNSLRNQFFIPIAFVLRLPVHLVHAIERWRAEVGPHIPDWLRAVGEFEALACISAFAFDHPDYPFPQIAESGSCFEARQIGHPLIPAASCVHNDLRLITSCGSSSLADQICRAKARCCGRSAQISCSPRPAPPSVPKR